MNWVSVTRGVITAVGAGLIAFDVLPFLSEPTGDTISEVLRDWGSKSSALPFGFGFLVGHWFWNGERKLSHTAALSWAGLIAAILHAVDPHPAASAILGIIVGRVLWPLSPTGAAPPSEH